MFYQPYPRRDVDPEALLASIVRAEVAIARDALRAVERLDVSIDSDVEEIESATRYLRDEDFEADIDTLVAALYDLRDRQSERRRDREALDVAFRNADRVARFLGASIDYVSTDERALDAIEAATLVVVDPVASRALAGDVEPMIVVAGVDID